MNARNVAIALGLLVGCGGTVTYRPGWSEEIRSASVTAVKRPAVFFGAIESWIEITVKSGDGPVQEVYMANLSAEQNVPAVGQTCDFTLQAGAVQDAVGDRLISNVRPAKMVEAFRCK